MKKYSFYLILYFLAYFTSNSQTWNWAKNLALDLPGWAHYLTADLEGNIYLQALDSGNTASIVKFDTDGNLLWKNNLPGVQISDISCAAGHVYISGNYQGTIQFSSTTLANSGRTDIFLACYGSAGNFLWVKSLGGATDQSVSTICTDQPGNVYLIGNYTDSLYAANSLITNSGWTTMFAASYDSLGNLRLLKSGGSKNTSSISNGRWIQVDAGGNIYLGGTFNDLLVDSLYIADGSEYYNEYSIPGFLCKLKPDGTAVWLKEVNREYEQMHDMALCGNAIYEVGQTYSWHAANTLTRGFYTVSGQQLYNNMGPGCFEWCNSGMNAVTNYGNFYTIGYTSDNSPPNYPNLHYLLLGANEIPCDADIYYSDIISLPNGGAVVCGMMNGNLQLGSLPLHTDSYKLFLAKFNGSSVQTSVNPYASHEVQIQPNPAHDKFTLTSINPNGFLRIFNAYGQTVHSSKLFSTLTEIDLSSLPKGIYFVEIISESGKSTRKIILE